MYAGSSFTGPFPLACVGGAAARTVLSKQGDGRSDVCSCSKSHPVPLRGWDWFCGAERGRTFLLGMPWCLCSKKSCCCLRQILSSGALPMSSASYKLKLSNLKKFIGFFFFLLSLFLCVGGKTRKTFLAPQIKDGKISQLNYCRSTLIDLTP